MKKIKILVLTQPRSSNYAIYSGLKELLADKYKEFDIEIEEETLKEIRQNFGLFKSSFLESNNLDYYNTDIVLIEDTSELKKDVLSLFAEKLAENKKKLKIIQDENEKAAAKHLEKQKLELEKKQKKNQERKLAKAEAAAKKEKELFEQLKNKFENDKNNNVEE